MLVHTKLEGIANKENTLKVNNCSRSVLHTVIINPINKIVKICRLMVLNSLKLNNVPLFLTVYIYYIYI